MEGVPEVGRHTPPAVADVLKVPSLLNDGRLAEPDLAGTDRPTPQGGVNFSPVLPVRGSLSEGGGCSAAVMSSNQGEFSTLW